MITYKEKAKELKGINPFMNWKVIDRKLTIWKESELRDFGVKEAYTIDVGSMKRGDAVFLSCEFLRQLSFRAHRRKQIAQLFPGMHLKIKSLYENKKPGFRVWCWNPLELKVNKPKGYLKIAV